MLLKTSEVGVTLYDIFIAKGKKGYSGRETLLDIAIRGNILRLTKCLMLYLRRL